MIKGVIVIILLNVTLAFSQMPEMPYYQLLDPRNEVGNSKQTITKLQSLFIQELFVKQLFSTPELIEFDEDPIYSTKDSNQLMNTIYAREISRMLAEQDLLNLNKYVVE
tara:strand:- start:535 stop:861 length:327 start_codon:yes stop_codon:yes gene_type:complete